MKCDFHTHSTASDGALSPSELVSAARQAGIEALAITDHDTLDAYRQLGTDVTGLRLIPGVEFSTRWHRIGIHVLGLNVDPDSDAMAEGVAHQTAARHSRAEEIADRLSKYGVPDPLAGARQYTDGGALGRPHFARHMVAAGFVRDENQAFKKFLGSGKSCDIRSCWADLSRVIHWIRVAGGVAVLAHPAKYKLTHNRLSALVSDFRAAGGEGLEVVSGRQLPATTRQLARLCKAQSLFASWGSDFHRPGQSWAQLGHYSTPPEDVKSLWQLWQ